MTYLSTGLHFIDAATYHADPCERPSLSSTIAKKLLKQSPLHAWEASPRLNPDHQSKDSATFDIGRAAHRAILGKGDDYVAIPDDLLAENGAASTKAAKEFIEEARAAGLTPLKADIVAQVEAMRDHAKIRLAENGIVINPSRSEVVAIAEFGGVMCRAMIDNAPEDPSLPLYDFKTCEDASPEACIRAVMNYGYDVQAAHYVDCWKGATGETRAFRFIFQEKPRPHEICVIELDYDAMVMGKKRITRAREMWRICTTQNHWPGYPAGVHQLPLPEFYQSKWLERESAEAEHKQRTGADIIEAAHRWQSPEQYKHAGE
jgi:hypothetical protein